MKRPAARSTFHSGFCVVLLSLCGGCGWYAACQTPMPDVYPLGAVNRAHYETMQANGQAAEFILHQNDFVGSTSELSPAGKDHVLEIAARARTMPFPVLIERSENNTSPGYIPGSEGWKTIERMGPVGVEISTTDSVMVMSHFMLKE